VSASVTDALLREARDLLADARSVVVVTGAGISAESGIPTFRGPGGLWKSHRPEDLATPEAFRRDPGLVWAWYTWRRGVVAGCRPNPGHRALAGLALDGAREVTLVTQNVDGLHEVAAWDEAAERGCAPSRPLDPAPALPLELHGSLLRDRCSGCGRRTPAAATVDASSEASLPRCGACGALLRPDVVWFGEMLDAHVLGRAFEAAGRAQLCLVVGTSALVHPAASVPLATLAAGGALVEVNPDTTPLTPRARVSLRGGAATLLPALLPQPHVPDPDTTPGEPVGP
jgi:NAD-dependent deacetylase